MHIIENLSFFLAPIHLGFIVNMKGRVNYTTKTTMEIEVDVSAQDALSENLSRIS